MADRGFLTRTADRTRFSVLLGVLVAVLLGTPFLPDEVRGLPIVRIAFTAIFVAGVFAVSGVRTVLWLALALALPGILSNWSSEILGWTALAALDFGTDILFFSFVAVVILRTVLAEDRVTTDTVYGGICVYRLIGMVWVTMYSALEYARPGSFIDGGVPVSDLNAGDRPGVYPELLYYSFVTFTTLGYGDISPTTQPARALSTAEAIVGQLFVAVFIARLVSLEVAHAARRSGDE